jgi:hypothetical protein
MVTTIKSWIYGYINPNKMIDILTVQRSPKIGFFATLLRSLMDSLFLFLPIYFLGRQPSLPSYLSFIKTENYYSFLALIIPFYFILQWLFLSGVLYIILRSLGKKIEFDHLLNIFGLISLVVGFFLILWDWPWIIARSENYMLLGVTHLIIDIWAIVLAIICLKKIIGIKIWLGVLLNIVWMILALPPAMLIMRSPL